MSQLGRKWMVKERRVVVNHLLFHGKEMITRDYSQKTIAMIVRTSENN